MHPSITSPVPVITFVDGYANVEAVYHSEYGAPLEAAAIGARTKSVSVAGTVSVDGETFSGCVSLLDLTESDPMWQLGDNLTIVAKTNEQGTWSETRYTAKTCGQPVVSITSGAGKLYGFPQEIAWSYHDFAGFFQNRWELRLRGSKLLGTTVVSQYSAKNSLKLDGSELAYAADVDGTVAKFVCELEVWSTSGLSSVVELELVPTKNTTTNTVSAAISKGRMTLDATEPFFLYALSRGVCTDCAYTTDGYLDFSLPVNDARYFAVSLSDKRVGRADEIVPTGKVTSGYLDFARDGVRQRLDVVYNTEEDVSISSDTEYVHFVGRTDPVAYVRNSTEQFGASCILLEPTDTASLVAALRGTEAVFRSRKQGIKRVMVDSVAIQKHASGAIAGTLSLSMTVVDGSPYKLFYGSPFFKDAQLYPGANVYPSGATWMVG